MSRETKHAARGGGDQAWLDDNPVERLKAITKLQDGIVHDGGGRGLQCPLCQRLKDWKKIDIPTNRLKIDIGDKRPNLLVVACTRVRHHQIALIKAVTKATGLSLEPRPSPSEIIWRMRHAVEQMRQTTKYKDLSPRARMLVDHLINAIFIDGEPNGGISRTGTELKTALGISSWRWLYEAIDATVGAGIVIRGSRGLSHGYKSGPSNLWGLACLPIDPNGRSKKRAEAAPKPRWASSRKRPKPQRTRGQCAGRTWRENVQKAGERAAQSFDNARPDSESYACVGDYPPKAPQAQPKQGPPGRGNFSSPVDERDGMDRLSLDAWPS
jgi:hypothetical protein